VDLGERLETADAALAHDDHDGAIAALVEAWREARHPRIADLASRVSAEATSRRPKIEGKTVPARIAAWRAAERGHTSSTSRAFWPLRGRPSGGTD
jgi:anti-sigma-K factor RskA